MNINPCPFCGNPGIPFRPDAEYYPNAWDIGCETDGCFMSEGCEYGIEKDEVIALWNQRPQPSAPVQPIAWCLNINGDLGHELHKTHDAAHRAAYLEQYENVLEVEIIPLYASPSAQPQPEEAANGPRDIKRLVDRFLGWKLPENFSPDAGISFKKTFNDHFPVPMKHEPTGTNLFDASQAEAMLRYVLELDK